MAIRSDGQDAVALTVFRRLGGNALPDLPRPRRGAGRRRASRPRRASSIVPVYDQALLVRTAIANVRDAILDRRPVQRADPAGVPQEHLRATLLAALSIPLSLVISFLFLRLTGDTLNLMSLGGLAVAIGLIIDDSVVVVENIARHLAEGQTGDEAIDRASREISGAVIGSTLTTILVFVPLAFVRGVVGQFFQSLSLALSVALLVSMVMSLTLVPVLAARFLARRRMPHTGRSTTVLADGYEGLLRVGLRFPRIAGAPGPAGRRARLVAVPASGDRLHAGDGRRGLHPRLRMPAGTSLAETDKVLRRVEAVLAGTPDVAGYIRRTGRRARLVRHRTLHAATSSSASSRPASAGRWSESIDDLREQLEAASARAGDRVRGRWLQDQINDLNGVERPIEVKVFGPDPAELAAAWPRGGQDRRRQPGGKDVNAHVHLGNPDIVIRPDSVQTARVGLTAMDVENAARTRPSTARWPARCPSKTGMTNIRVRYPDAVRFDRQAAGPLADQPAGRRPRRAARRRAVAGRPGFVPLGQLASIERVRSPNELWRENQQPVITVTAELGDRDLGSLNRELHARLARARLPARLSLGTGRQLPAAAGVVCQPAGRADRGLGAGVPAAGVPVPQPDAAAADLPHPADLAGQRPVRPAGSPARRLNVSSFMGAILLIGLDVKNGIILIEYIGQLHRPGMPLRRGPGRRPAAPASARS